MQHTHPETDELGRENYAYHKRLQLGKKLKFLKPPREFRKYRGHQAPKTQNIICSLGCLIIYVNTKWCPFFQEGQATGSRTEEERRGLDRLQQRKTDNHTRFLSLLYNCECLVPPPPLHSSSPEPATVVERKLYVFILLRKQYSRGVTIPIRSTCLIALLAVSTNKLTCAFAATTREKAVTARRPPRAALSCFRGGKLEVSREYLIPTQILCRRETTELHLNPTPPSCQFRPSPSPPSPKHSLRKTAGRPLLIP